MDTKFYPGTPVSIAVALLWIFSCCASIGQTYLVTDLGAPGELASYATGMNTNGVVSGYSLMSDGVTYRAWKWSTNAGRAFLPDWGGSDARALGVNDAGQVVGFALDPDGVAHGFIHTDASGLQDIGGASATQGVLPQAINRQGHVTGYVTTSDGNRPFLWTGSGSLVVLGVLPGVDIPAEALAYDLNDLDELAGEASGSFGGSRGFAVLSATPRALSALDTLGGETATAYDVNNTHAIVGEAETSTGAQHAFLHDGIFMRDLGTLGGLNSTAFALTELGDVVGASDILSGASHAFIWSAGEGLEDLNSFIDPKLGWTLNEAHAVTEEGWVSGNGTYLGSPRAFLIVPRDGPDEVPPSLVAMLSATRLESTSFSPITVTLSAWDDVGLELKTIEANALRVVGPGGYSATPTFISRTPATNGIQATALFQIQPRGGWWDGADNGDYTVRLEPAVIRDMAGNFAPSGTLGSFTVRIDVAAALQVSGPSSANVGDDIAFALNARGSYPSVVPVAFQYQVEWEGQGNAVENLAGGTLLNVTHRYQTPGARMVRFISLDSNGSEAAVTRVINVRPLPSGGWTLGPSLKDIRSDFAGVSFKNRFYLIGGFPFTTAGDPLGTVQSWAWGDAEWQDEASLEGAFVRMGAGVDSRGRVVAFGGAESDGDAVVLTSAGFTYVPGAGRSTGIAALPEVVDRFAYATDSSGRIYCLGGLIGGSASTTVRRYDGTKNTWTTLAPMPQGRYASAACDDGRGHILVIGGFVSAGAVSASVFSFGIASGEWSVAVSQPEASAEQAAALGGDGLVYVIGGRGGSSAVYVMDPSKGTWLVGPSMNDARRAPALWRANATHLVAIGGDTDSVEVLDTRVGIPARILTSDANLVSTAGSLISLQPLSAGSPLPKWLLVSGPIGMSVHPDTGAVDWMAQQGSFTTIIRAQNAGGIADLVLNLVVSSSDGIPPGGADKLPPTPPSLVIATNITDIAATLRWGASTDNVKLAGYRLYNYTRRCSGFKCIRKITVSHRLADNLTATTFNRTGLSPGQSYTFGVAAFDAAGNESSHTRVSFLTLSPPRIVAGPAYDQNFAIVNEPFHWRFAAMGNPLPSLSLVHGPTGLSFFWDITQHVGVATWSPVQGPAGDTAIVLKAVNTVTNLEQSFTVKVYPAGTDLYPPSAVSSVAIVPESVGPDRVTLSWLPATDNHEVAGYKMTAVTSVRVRSRRTCGRGCYSRGYRTIAVSRYSAGPGTHYTLLGLNPNTHYAVYVQAVDTAGFVGPASPATGGYPYSYGLSFTTRPLYAAQLAILSDGRQSFSWEVPEPPVVRVGDFYNYTVFCAPALSNTVWNPLPGVAWPITESSIIVPPGTATNAFYKVSAEWVTH